jgi:hypothetical protein
MVGENRSVGVLRVLIPQMQFDEATHCDDHFHGALSARAASRPYVRNHIIKFGSLLSITNKEIAHPMPSGAQRWLKQMKVLKRTETSLLRNNKTIRASLLQTSNQFKSYHSINNS